MRILMVTAEYAPFAKAGGLADMVTGLSRALVAAGHEVRVVLPRYAMLEPGPIRIGEPQVSPVAVDGGHPAYELRGAAVAGAGEPALCLVECPPLFGGGTVYASGEAEARRFALLAHAALRLVEVLDWRPDIIHCHDWHAALVPVLLRSGYRTSGPLRGAATVLTIHNIGYQGAFAPALLPELGITAPEAGIPELNFLRAGIESADALTTVSPSHAEEILTPEYGMGLDPLLRQRRARLVGILNGVDYGAWDPATDPALPARFDARDLAGKATCRAALLERAGLPDRPGRPLLGMVSRLAEQKGIDLAVAALDGRLRAGDVQAVIVGQGEERYVARLRDLAAAMPGEFRFLEVQDEALARLVFAGSDAFLVPSRYEPCGLTQLYALRYGSVPVVRDTGGLRDTVRHFDPRAGTGTGSVFRDADANGLDWAIGEILAWYRQPEAWRRLQQNGMAEDYSWRHQAPHYEALYLRLAGVPA